MKTLSEIHSVESKMKQSVTIDGREIGPNAPPYVVAELSANHNGDINRAFQIIEESKKAGADAIKLQTYTPDTITIDFDSEEFQIQGGLWGGQTLYDLYKSAYMPWDWHKPLFDKARELEITIFSTPFDFSAIDLLEDLGAPAYKIASFEVIDLPLVKRVAETGKPIIISTGMADKVEIEEAVQAARDSGCKHPIVLHCVSEYPAPSSNYNLRTMGDIAQRYDVLTGLSDHTIDNASAVASVALGACLIEKHVTLDRNGGGADDSFSLEPSELTNLCRDVKTAWEALGGVNYERSEAEKGNKKFRRSIYVVQDIKAGDKFTKDNIRSIRPGFGMLPKHYEAVINKTATVDILRGTPLQAHHFI